MTTELIESIERSIKQAHITVDTGAALERLRNNKDFKKIVLEGYFNQEAVRLVHLKGDPSMQSVDSQRSIVQQMDAIGSFSQYLTVVLQMAALAGKQAEADEAARDEILAEELNND